MWGSGNKVTYELEGRRFLPRGHKARILDQMPRARQRITYLLSCFATELVHRCLGVFCTVFTSVHWGQWYVLRRDARGGKA